MKKGGSSNHVTTNILLPSSILFTSPPLGRPAFALIDLLASPLLLLLLLLLLCAAAISHE